MAKRILPAPEQLRQLLRYDPETGRFYWKERPVEMFPDLRAWRIWNTKNSGSETFITRHAQGYLSASVFDKMLLAHRVAWAIYYGRWPVEHIDHISGDKTDNRISNLREADRMQNLQNRPSQSNNTSGFKGVFFDKRRRAWFSQIVARRKQIYLGSFETPEMAHAAYCKAAKKYHGEFARTE